MAEKRPQFWYRKKVKKTYQELQREYGEQEKEKEAKEAKERRKKRGLGKGRLRELAGGKSQLGL